MTKEGVAQGCGQISFFRLTEIGPDLELATPVDQEKCGGASVPLLENGIEPRAVEILLVAAASRIGSKDPKTGRGEKQTFDGVALAGVAAEENDGEGDFGTVEADDRPGAGEPKACGHDSAEAEDEGDQAPQAGRTEAAVRGYDGFEEWFASRH